MVMVQRRINARPCQVSNSCNSSYMSCLLRGACDNNIAQMRQTEFERTIARMPISFDAHHISESAATTQTRGSSKARTQPEATIIILHLNDVSAFNRARSAVKLLFLYLLRGIHHRARHDDDNHHVVYGQRALHHIDARRGICKIKNHNRHLHSPNVLRFFSVLVVDVPLYERLCWRTGTSTDELCRIFLRARFCRARMLCHHLASVFLPRSLYICENAAYSATRDIFVELAVSICRSKTKLHSPGLHYYCAAAHHT